MNAISGARRLIERYPRLKSFLQTVARPFRSATSTHYSRLAADDVEAVAGRLQRAWQAMEIPARQREGVDRQLAAYRAGSRDAGFDVLIDTLRPLADQRAGAERPLTLLEVGCSSGYYSEAFEIKGLRTAYSGCDYSAAFVEMAKLYYPALDFQVQNATKLGYSDDAFDVVVSGCCLLHIGDYASAVREAARVARSHVVFHRTPVLHRNPTTWYTKRAYGVETVEIHFNEQHLVALFAEHGLRVVGIATLHVDWQDGDAFASKTYLCEKSQR